MKYFLVLLISLIVVGVSVAHKYNLSHADQTRLQLVLRNNRLFNSYYRCLMDVGACNSSGLTLKRLIPTAMSNGCADCSPRQISLVKYICQYMIPNRPKEWRKIRQRYDPQNNCTRQFEDFLNN